MNQVYQTKYKNWDIVVLNNGFPSHPFEWKISRQNKGVEFTKNDPTSRRDIDSTVVEAQRVVDFYISNPQEMDKVKPIKSTPRFK